MNKKNKKIKNIKALKKLIKLKSTILLKDFLISENK